MPAVSGTMTHQSQHQTTKSTTTTGHLAAIHTPSITTCTVMEASSITSTQEIIPEEDPGCAVNTEDNDN